ncbi:hypothetical protein TVAG_466130 [Trichomonas vaginalis G3]|uniref:Initiator binding domain-containing protein n=1 Tax=Trichomonas vaginalis (strain ATCC PRA-98 / G3) TaxID=412133 RepID=A2EX94_TRIV3|nr:transcription-initiator DNA-binding domain ibd family [Trichomonas vaginalis G3]EAY02753.1 hypothetical protein TVAG_466130 [Trichomonas vaginalis G3]KAI5517254.1 transcription-initiator DNA-binding domain ibd family [Trichomonas vaginalis G3]|eukprot:XP_001314976.1 hypothetical protein [Trichomonas vaginalis G3]
MEAPSDMSIVEWEKLSLSDREGYLRMRDMLTSPACKNRRNKSAETFVDVVETIKAFVMRGDSGDLQRGIVCGMYWVGEDLAINTRQLRILLQKCKSSINGSLQMIGYASPVASTDTSSVLINLFPFWKDNFKELRQWTIRRKAQTPHTHVLPKNFVPRVLINPTMEKLIQNSAAPDFPTPPPDAKNEQESNHVIEISVADPVNLEPPTFQEFDIKDHMDLDTGIKFEDDSFGMWNNFDIDFDL